MKGREQYMAKVQGKGSIIQVEKDKPASRCRSWKLQVSLGKDPRTGKYRRATKRFAGTYSQANMALREFVQEVEGNNVQGKTGWTFSSYAKRYLERRGAKREAAPSTIKKQHDQFKAANMHIGELPLERITPAVLDEMYMAMLSGETLSGKPSGGSYVNQIHDNLTLVFAQAVEEGLLSANPCDKATPPKMDIKPKKALSKEQVTELIERLDPRQPRDLAYLLAVTLGLRRGEISALEWRDIDFEGRCVSITRAVDTLGNVKGTKTKAGTRILPLPDITFNALKEAMVAQALQFAKTNSFRTLEEGYLEQGPQTPVVASKKGERLYPSSLSRWWSEDREGYGLATFTLHELRHTYLTMLARSNVHPKVMQELAGHYSCQITMDIYTHVNMLAKQEAVSAVSELFEPAQDQPALAAENVVSFKAASTQAAAPSDQPVRNQL